MLYFLNLSQRMRFFQRALLTDDIIRRFGYLHPVTVVFICRNVVVLEYRIRSVRRL